VRAIANHLYVLHLSSHLALAVIVALGVTAAATSAQVPPVSLCGQATNQGAVHDVVLGLCTAPVTLCTTGLAVPTGFEGGSAYDPVNQLYWHSNGSRLQASASTVGFECEPYCDVLSPVANLTGLAFDARSSKLWILGAAPEIVRTNGGVCPVVESRCSLAAVIPSRMVAAGLALSEKRGLLFYAASAPGAAPANVIIVATISDPCRGVCTIDLGAAFGSPQVDPITGLGYDDCDDELFVVAGSAGIVRARLALPSCSVTAVSRCTPSAYRFHGLCLQPPPSSVVGRFCTPEPCRHCTNHLRSNDAALGNTSFLLSIYSAPRGGVAVPLLGVGGCTAGVSVLCGRFHPALSPAPIALPPLQLAGPSSCQGAAILRLPIAAESPLCGLQLCIQAVVSCPAGGFGLSDALGIRVVGA
jgi:hypothetical protein